MPLPKPKTGEGKDDFLERCMGNETMGDEYPDEKQRYAVCSSLWKQEEKMEREVRVFPIELRATDDGKHTIVGYASVFDQWSEDLGGFKERVKPGAFKKTIKESDIRALFNHDPNYVLGRNKAGTLTLEEDDKGLAIEVTPPDTQWARDLTTSIDRGDINQMSFGFQTIKDEWDNKDKENVTRDLLEVRLFDVSPVTYPAYPQTTVDVRNKVSELTAEPVPEDHSDEAPEPGPTSHSIRKKRQELLEAELDYSEEESYDH